MEGSLLLIDEEEMRLKGEECRQFLTYTLGLKSADEKLNHIIENANGWIGGAQLMAVAWQAGRNGCASYANADDRVMYAYIEKEIFDFLSPEEQLFLKKTAVPGYFNEEICREYLPEYPFSHMMQVPMQQIIKNSNFAYQYFFCYYAALESRQCQQIYEYVSEHMKEDETFQAFQNVDLFLNFNWALKEVRVLDLEQIDRMPLNRVTKAYLLIKEAYFLFLGDQVSMSMEYLKRAEEINTTIENSYIDYFVLAEKTQILEDYGELTRALQLYEKMKRVISEMPTMQSSYYIGIAGVHMRQMRLSEAEEELRQAKAAMGNEVENLNSAYLYTLAEWYYLSGCPEKTEEIMLSLVKEEPYQSVFFSARLLRYPVYRGKNRTLAEDFRKNYEAAKEADKNKDSELLYVGVLYEQGEQKQALQMAGALVAQARKTKNKLKIVEGTLLTLRFLWGMGERGLRIKNLLLEALSYAVPERILQPFWFEKEALKQIVRESSQELEKVLSSNEQKFLRYILQSEDRKIRTGLIPEELTPREIEVLEEMAKGIPNREIAEHLCISLATVKTHLINIYGKLGVNNRMSAVNKWKEMSG